VNLDDWKNDLEIRQELEDIIRQQQRKAILKTLFWVGIAVVIVILYLKCKNQ
jgi:hypothetical protein